CRDRRCCRLRGGGGRLEVGVGRMAGKLPSHAGRVLYCFRQLVIDNTDRLAHVLTREHGKVLAAAPGEVARGIESIEYAAGIPQLRKGEYSEQASSGVDVHSIRQPLAAIGCITPFNFPIMVPLWMCANAVAFGNTVVVKP